MRKDDFALNMKLGQKVKILRSDKVTVTEATVAQFTASVEDRYFMAPELVTFRVEFIDPSRGHSKPLTKWCSASDLVLDDNT